MAKKPMASVQTGSGKAHTKVIRMVKTEKGSYTFKQEIVLNEKVNDWFAKNQK